MHGHPFLSLQTHRLADKWRATHPEIGHGVHSSSQGLFVSIMVVGLVSSIATIVALTLVPSLLILVGGLAISLTTDLGLDSFKTNIRLLTLSSSDHCQLLVQIFTQELLDTGIFLQAAE